MDEHEVKEVIARSSFYHPTAYDALDTNTKAAITKWYSDLHDGKNGQVSMAIASLCDDLLAEVGDESQYSTETQQAIQRLRSVHDTVNRNCSLLAPDHLAMFIATGNVDENLHSSALFRAIDIDETVVQELREAVQQIFTEPSLQQHQRQTAEKQSEIHKRCKQHGLGSFKLKKSRPQSVAETTPSSVTITNRETLREWMKQSYFYEAKKYIVDNLADHELDQIIEWHKKVSEDPNYQQAVYMHKACEDLLSMNLITGEDKRAIEAIQSQISSTAELLKPDHIVLFLPEFKEAPNSSLFSPQKIEPDLQSRWLAVIKQASENEFANLDPTKKEKLAEYLVKLEKTRPKQKSESTQNRTNSSSETQSEIPNSAVNQANVQRLEVQIKVEAAISRQIASRQEKLLVSLGVNHDSDLKALKTSKLDEMKPLKKTLGKLKDPTVRGLVLKEIARLQRDIWRTRELELLNRAQKFLSNVIKKQSKLLAAIKQKLPLKTRMKHSAQTLRREKRREQTYKIRGQLTKQKNALKGALSEKFKGIPKPMLFKGSKNPLRRDASSDESTRNKPKRQ